MFAAFLVWKAHEDSDHKASLISVFAAPTTVPDSYKYILNISPLNEFIKLMYRWL